MDYGYNSYIVIMKERYDTTWFADLSEDWRTLLIAAAVLEQFDAAALTAICDHPVPILAQLIEAGLIQADERTYHLADELQPVAATMLAEASATQQRTLAERAVAYFARQLSAATDAEYDTVELTYMRHLERLCELLIQHEPTALAAVATAVPITWLRMACHRHLVWYYQGLGTGFCDQFSQAQQIFARVLAEPDLDDFIRARTLNSSAWFALDQGDYARTQACYAESLAIWKRLGNSLRQGMVLLNMGFLHYELQDYPTAEAMVRESIPLFQAADTEYHQAMAYNALGLIQRDQGQWEAARTLFQTALYAFARSEADDYRGRVALNIGELELLCGNLAAAEAWFDQALSLMTTRIHTIEIYFNRGLIQQISGDHKTALDYYRVAIALAQEIGRREILPLLHYRIATAEQRLGQTAQAMQAYSAALAAIETTREPVRDEDMVMRLMGRWQEIYANAILFCLEQGDAMTAFTYSERARARAFADLLARRGDDLADIQAVPITTAEVQASLPPGTSLLAYFTTGLRGPEIALLDAMPSEAAPVRACLATPARLLLLAITPTDIRAEVCALDPNVLHSTSAFMADGRRFLRPPILRRAYDALIAPVEDLLDAASQVIIAPHGPLHQLTFAALLDENNQPLLDRVPRLSYTPSATTLLRTPQLASTDGQQPCLALGYDGGAERLLRHTSAEATSVAQVCGGVVWRGAADVCARLMHEAGHYRWLHLACHGEFDLEDPLNSWLEVGPDQQLRAVDILRDMRLQADLVTLSACRSGVSRILRGDEPMGLVRAFLGAGAQAVLVTLWPVEDTSARLLMERFYRELLTHKRPDPAAALHAAQRYLRALTVAEIRTHLPDWDGASRDSFDETAQPYASPEFWAAYALVGGTVSIST